MVYTTTKVTQLRQERVLEILSNSNTENSLDPQLSTLLGACCTVFTDDLSAELPHQGDVDHKIDVGPDSKRPHRSAL